MSPPATWNATHESSHPISNTKNNTRNMKSRNTQPPSLSVVFTCPLNCTIHVAQAASILSSQLSKRYKRHRRRVRKRLEAFRRRIAARQAPVGYPERTWENVSGLTLVEILLRGRQRARHANATIAAKANSGSSCNFGRETPTQSDQGDEW
jgi:hypothetical protein